MAILAALLAIGSRFATKILTAALGWASTLLFGRVPASRQLFVLGVSFGSVIWMVLVLGVLFPDVATFLLLFVPPQGFIPESVIRLGMLIGAIVLPAVIGILVGFLAPNGTRTPRAFLVGAARGYALTVVLAGMLILLAGLAIWRRITSLIRGWTDAHVPLVVMEGQYDSVAADLDAALDRAGLDLVSRPAPTLMAAPGRLLARIAGRDASSLVPERMLELYSDDLNVLIYPMDVLVSGKKQLVMRARAAVATELTTAAAHLTVSAAGQAIEDRVRDLALHPPDGEGAFGEGTAATFREIDESLRTTELDYDEWEVLYRQRLQIERNLRAAAMQNVQEDPEPSTVPAWLRSGSEAIVDLVKDERTRDVVEVAGGPGVRIVVRLALAGILAAQMLLRRRREPSRQEVGDG